jgi:hypothetical protein
LAAFVVAPPDFAVAPPAFVWAWELPFPLPLFPLAYAEFANVIATTRAATRTEKRFMGFLGCETAVKVRGNRLRVASP